MRARPLETDAETSLRLSRIPQSNTGPELIVRQLLHALGHRFRLKNRDLPGSPDIANRARRWAVFVHGCFWHAHEGCSRSSVPKRNRAFWKQKFAENRARDQRAEEELLGAGWAVVTIWECELYSLAGVSEVTHRLDAIVGDAR